MNPDTIPDKAAGWSVKCSLNVLKIFSACDRKMGLLRKDEKRNKFITDTELGLGSDPSWSIK